MASIVYDNKAIIPAPLVNINKVYAISNDGSKHGLLYEISLRGTLLPFRGSPIANYPLGSPASSFWTGTGGPPDEPFSDVDDAFSSLLRKQEALRWLFREDGKVLEWFGGPNPPIKCRPKINSITFPEGQWADRAEYVIELTAESLTGLVDEDNFDASGLQSVSDEWQFNDLVGQEGNVFEISHTISAQGILTFDETFGTEIQAYLNAKTWVDDRINGLPDSAFVNFATNFVNWVSGRYVKNTVIAEKDGSYAITEIWIIREAGPGETAATYQEESFTVTKKEDNDSIDVSYTGTIFGLQDKEKTGGASALSNAKNAVPTNIQAKASAEDALGSLLESFVIPISPSNKSIVLNEKDGLVSFTFDWSAGENANFTQSNDATLSFSSSDGIYTLVLNVDIEGKGDTVEEKLNNARSNILSDVNARILALSLIGSQRPTGITFTGDHVGKSSAVSETRGTSRTSWTWTDRDPNNIDINIEINFPKTISAKITIPGRIAGPIIQRINTLTAKQITVNYRSEGHGSVQPNTDSVADIMDEAGNIPFGLFVSRFFPGSFILENDRETWNPTTGKYTRVRTHTVMEAGR